LAQAAVLARPVGGQPAALAEALVDPVRVDLLAPRRAPVALHLLAHLGAGEVVADVALERELLGGQPEVQQDASRGIGISSARRTRVASASTWGGRRIV